MTYFKTLSAGAAVLLAVSGAGILSAPPAAAQDAAASRAGTRPVSEIVSRLSQGAGVPILADATVSGERIALPTVQTTPQNFEQQIAEVVKALPEGTTWAKLYLPAPQGGRGWNGDDVAGYAFAQAKLFGPVGAAPAGTVEILGKRLPPDKAAQYIADLDLKPVYLVTNPAKRTAAPGANIAARWNQMTPEQQQQYAQQQATQLLNADPAVRREMMQNMMRQSTPERAILRQMFRQMSPEQRRQFGQDMGRGRGDRGDGQRGPRGQRGTGVNP